MFVNHTFAQKISQEKWQEQAEKYDYQDPKNSPPKKEKEKKQEKEESKNRQNGTQKDLSNGFGNFGNWLLYVIVAIGLVALLIALSKQNLFLRNKKVELRKEIDQENPETLELTDLERGLQNALQNENYRLALRLQFLILLEKLEQHRLIKWHKYTTNGEYLNQLIAYKHHNKISMLTYIYEYFWYGENDLNQNKYERLNKEFDKLKQAINE
ncbi:MAG: hypothetical protein R3A43_04900 [Bacteroidia bacterium]